VSETVSPIFQDLYVNSMSTNIHNMLYIFQHYCTHFLICQNLNICFMILGALKMSKCQQTFGVGERGSRL